MEKRQIFGPPNRDVAENANAQSRKLVDDFKEKKTATEVQKILKKMDEATTQYFPGI